MSSVFFELETLNPNLRTTYFQIRNFTNYIANSKYVIRNEDTEHGLFGKIKGFEDIQKVECVDKIEKYITSLAQDKIPIFRGIISLKEIDACRLGYYEQEKWKNVLEDRLPSIAEKLNQKYEDLEYVGAVHIEDGHPHLQFMIWSKYKKNYFIDYRIKNKLRKEFTNQIFREDLLPIYQEKDIAKKNITSENYILGELKKITDDKELLDELMQYERDFYQTKKIRNILKDDDIKEIVDLLFELKEELKETTGSIKYQYLLRYPEVIEKVDRISNLIIDSSLQCQKEIDKYIKAKQELVEFQYSNQDKLLKAKEKVKINTEQEVIKLIGNQILDLERKWLNYKEEYQYIRYNNDTRNLLDNILTALYYQSVNQKRINNYEFRYKKQLSKQAKKELAIQKRNSSSWNWEDEI